MHTLLSPLRKGEALVWAPSLQGTSSTQDSSCHQRSLVLTAPLGEGERGRRRFIDVASHLKSGSHRSRGFATKENPASVGIQALQQRAHPLADFNPCVYFCAWVLGGNRFVAKTELERHKVMRLRVHSWVNRSLWQ